MNKVSLAFTISPLSIIGWTILTFLSYFPHDSGPPIYLFLTFLIYAFPIWALIILLVGGLIRLTPFGRSIQQITLVIKVFVGIIAVAIGIGFLGVNPDVTQVFHFIGIMSLSILAYLYYRMIEEGNQE
ncbi:MAG: hypothetical protein MK105_10740 [Crocinitomicaceae bacterium]|nr:hypothetical protein [Crocinitomicaceae bacterium]